MLEIGFASVASLLPVLALLAAFAWPRGRLTHRYEVFVAAPPQTVWDTYFAHVNKVNYRPGTRVLDAEILGESPLTVRLTVQQDIASEPRQVTFTYDLYEPYTRYRLHEDSAGLVEEGEFTAEPGGTRLRLAVAGAMRGFVLPAIARRRVQRNQQALKDFCEGRKPPPPRAPLPQSARWEAWVVLLAVAALWLPLPWQAQLVLGIAAIGVAALWLWRLAALARRL